MPTLTEDIRRGKTITAIASEHGVSRSTIHTRLKTNGLNHQRLKFNHDFFENIDCEEKAYWLGFIMADGCVSLTQSPKVTIKLHQKDEQHLTAWHKALGSCLKIHYFGNTVYSTHYSDKMCQDLIGLGCIPKKSLTLKFPVLREDLIRHFIRGYFDGDGCIFKSRRGQLRIIFLGTRIFLNLLKIWLKCSSNIKPHNNGRICRLEIHGNKKATKIAKLMYENATIALNRKLEVYHSNI